MDIGYKTTTGKFSLRAAALIMHENKLLLVKNQKLGCFYTVGGGIQENETSENAVSRECYEETGCQFEIDRLIFVQERFYQVESVGHHEIVFFYLMKGTDIALPNGINTDQGNEMLYWIPLEELEKINLVPTFLKTAVKELPNEIVHIISHE